MYKDQVVDDNAVFDYTVRAVGTSATAVRTLQRAVAVQLVAWTPEIPGRRCRPVKFTGGDDEPRPDGSVKPPLFFADDEYELRSFFRNEGS